MSNNTYKTENFYLGVFLIYNELVLVSITQNGGNRKTFNFSNSPHLQGKIEEFFNLENKINVDLREWLEKQRWLKSALHENN